MANLQQSQPDWVDRVKETHNFHASKLKEFPKWRIVDTARVLKRSKSSIGQELEVASWLRSHERELLKFDYLHEAIEFVRDKKKKILTEEI